jgi:curved DNA-binding protein CbpA
MKNRRNYYRILHVQPDAPREIIRSSYQTMMQRMRMHPDLGGDDKNAAMINEAYATLTDTRNRCVYDESRQSKERTAAYRKSAYRTSVQQHNCAFCRYPYELEEDTPAETLCVNCQSPLFMTRQAPADECDRRSNPRMPNNQSLSFCTQWPQSDAHSARADDISLLGMKFFTATSVELGQIVKIDSQILRAVARVTRSERRGSSWGVGVQFLSLYFVQSQGSFVTARV